MNQKLKKYRKYLIGILLLAVFAGCEKRPEGLLSRSEMTDFLYDLHKLDGTLMANGFGQAEDRENVYYYNSLLKKYGITQAQFDSSVVWYTAHPKTYEKIYIEVLDRLNKLEADVEKGVYLPVDSAALRNSFREMWPKKSNFTFTTDSTPDKVSFSIIDSQLRWNDRYTLRLLQRLSSEKDSLLQKRVVFRIHYAGGITDSISAMVKPDSVLRRYTLMLRAKRQLPIEKISGELLSDTSMSKKYFAKIDSISFMRHYDQLAQDSIKTVIEKIQFEKDSINALKNKKKPTADTIKPTVDTSKPTPEKMQKVKPGGDMPKMIND